MKQIKRTVSLILIISMACAYAIWFSACESKTVTYDYMIAYTNSTNDDIEYLGYNMPDKESKDTDGIVSELLDQLFNVNKEDGVHYSPLPKSVSFNSYKINEDTVTIDFSEGFSELNNVQKQILKACVGLTLNQIDEIEKFAFTQDGQPITDNDGRDAGTMSIDQYVKLVLSEDQMLVQETELKIYFANKAGNLLIPENCKFTLDNHNESLEQYIVEKLMEGPDSETSEGFPTIDPDVELISIITTDKTCYINFSDKFLNQERTCNDEIMIYSIVNSLCELAYVDNVRFLINGESDVKLNMTFDLSKPLTANPNLV